MRNHIFNYCIIGLIFTTLLSTACKKEIVSFKEKSAQEQFEYAKKFFDKKDYYRAKNQFTRVLLNNQGNSIVEPTQFYLAESYFNSKEYILAIEEYRKLVNSMPQSEYVDDANYKIALCFYKLSPKYSLDQDYTVKAIDQLQIFLEDYPDSDFTEKARFKLLECRNKLGLKEFKTGELYRRMGYHRAALLSFKNVLENYQDTEYVDDALFFIGSSQMIMGNFEDAEISFTRLITEYKNSEYVEKAEIQLKEIKNRLSKYKVKK